MATVVLTVLGIVSVRADPSSKLHLNVGIAWLGLRIVYLIVLTSLAFPEGHRAGSACEACERLGAHSRVVAVLVVLALGVVMGVQAPSGSLSGRTQIAATLASNDIWRSLICAAGRQSCWTRPRHALGL